MKIIMSIFILLSWQFRAEAMEQQAEAAEAFAPSPVIFYEDKIDFSPDIKKLENPENLQISIQLQSLNDFFHSPYASPDLVNILTNGEDLEIISARATTIMRATSPARLQGLISDEYFMNSAFKKSHYQRIDPQNLSMCQKIKIKPLKYQIEINSNIHHVSHYDLENCFEQNQLQEYLRIVMEKDKAFYQKFGYPISAVDIDVVADMGIKKGKIIVFFFQHENNDTFVISYNFFAVEKFYVRFIHNVIFKKISHYAINKFAPIYRRHVNQEISKANNLSAEQT